MLTKLYDGYVRITNDMLRTMVQVLPTQAKQLEDNVQAVLWLNEVEVDGVTYPYNLGIERRRLEESGDKGYHQREVQRTDHYFGYELIVYIDDVPVTAFLEDGSPNIKMVYNSVAQPHQFEVLIKVLEAMTPLVTGGTIEGAQRIFNTPDQASAYSLT